LTSPACVGWLTLRSSTLERLFVRTIYIDHSIVTYEPWWPCLGAPLHRAKFSSLCRSGTCLRSALRPTKLSVSGALCFLIHSYRYRYQACCAELARDTLKTMSLGEICTTPDSLSATLATF